MKVLVINAGSSSLKYQVIEMDNESRICKGLVERIGEDNACLKHEPSNKAKYERVAPMYNHTEALKAVLEALTDAEHGVVSDVSEIKAVGHRVLHSGEDFTDSVVIDEGTVMLNEIVEISVAVGSYTSSREAGKLTVCDLDIA